MDKFYFTPPQGNAPRVVRAILSELSCQALAIDEETSAEIEQSQQVLETLIRLFNHNHYVQHQANFAFHLESDLYRACCYWEEVWRYEQSWPLIAKILEAHAPRFEVK